jgi:hypothetical protein
MSPALLPHPPGPCIRPHKHPAPVLGPRYLKWYTSSVCLFRAITSCRNTWSSGTQRSTQHQCIFLRLPPPLGDPGAAPPALGRGVIRYKFNPSPFPIHVERVESDTLGLKPMFRYRNLIRSPCFQHFRSRWVVGCWEMVLVWGVAANSWRWGRGTRARSGLFWRLTAFANNHFCVEKQDTGGVSSPARKRQRAGSRGPALDKVLPVGAGGPGGGSAKSAPPRARRQRARRNPQPSSSLESDDDGLDDNDRALAAALGALASGGGRGFEDGDCLDSVWGAGDEDDSEDEGVVDPDLAGDPDLPDEGSVFHVVLAAPRQRAVCPSLCHSPTLPLRVY